MNHKWLSVTSETELHKSCHEGKLLTYKGRMPLLDNEKFLHPPAFSVHILALVSELFFLCISYIFTSVCEYHGNISSECHCITATPRKILIHFLDCSASRFQHILILTAYFQHRKKSNLTPKYLSHPLVPLISVFNDSVLHYCLPNLSVTDIIFQCFCCA